MVTAMFVLGAAMVRTGAAERLGGKLFRACARSEMLLQAAILVVTTLFSMFMNDTTVVLVFLPIIMAHLQGAESLPVALSALRGLWFVARGAVDAGGDAQQHHHQRLTCASTRGSGIGFFDFTPIAAVVFAAAAGLFPAGWPEVSAQGRAGGVSRGDAWPASI